jgi:hypothetical protein
MAARDRRLDGGALLRVDLELEFELDHCGGINPAAR